MRGRVRPGIFVGLGLLAAGGVSQLSVHSSALDVGPPTQIAVESGDNQTAVVSTAVATSPSVIVRDALNQPVPGVPVTFSVTSGGGAFPFAVASVMGGFRHSCSLTPSGGVKCWGSNSQGSLGDGTLAFRTVAVDVVGLQSGIAALQTNGLGEHTCAVTIAGGIKCWGPNFFGQLGNGANAIAQTTPVSVLTLESGVANVAVGTYHTCALTTGGAVKCWGANFSGQLGDGTLTDRSSPVAVSGLSSGVAQITAGTEHTCALTTTGGVKCWGANYYGELGDGTLTLRSAPANVAGLTSGVASIMAGGTHTCAITTLGQVKCWGENSRGQVGDASFVNRTTAVNVTGLASGVTNLSLGYWHSCAFTSSNGVKCWGQNYNGALGDGTLTDRNIPVDVFGLTSGVSQLAAAGFHSCVRMVTGEVQCWGYNNVGRLGDGTLITRTTPVETVGGASAAVVTDVSGIASPPDWVLGPTPGASNNTMTAMASGLSGSPVTFMASSTVGPATQMALDAGDNQAAPIGTGVSVAPSVLVRDTNDNVVPDVEVTFAVTEGGGGVTGGLATTTGTGVATVGSWTLGPGIGTNNNSLTASVPGLIGSPVTFTATGFGPAAQIASAGGNNQKANAGTAVATPPSVLVRDAANNPVPGVAVTFAVGLGGGSVAGGAAVTDTLGLASVVSWTLGTTPGVSNNTLVATAPGVAGSPITYTATAVGPPFKITVAAGDNQNAAAGSPVLIPPAVLVQDAFDSPVTGVAVAFAPTSGSGYLSGLTGQVAPTQDFTCALTPAGGVQCWGRNDSGQLGNGTFIPAASPVAVSGLQSGVVQLATGTSHACAITGVGAVKCWGFNGSGQLGDGTTVARSIPVSVAGLSTGVVAIAAGSAHTCALGATGGLKCWGANSSGQLGDGTTTLRFAPVDVSGLASGVASVVAAFSRTCAVTAAGGARCWGFNGNGEVGDGTTTQRLVPTDVSGLTSGVARLSAAGSHTCAVTSTGGAKCWGFNGSGRLGDGTTTNRTTPANVSGLATGVATISAGITHTCALTTGGAVKCWGSNSSGQLGDGSFTSRTTPVAVTGLSGGVSQVASGSFTACAVSASGLKCWGSNVSGQLGDGTLTSRTTPTDVVGLSAAAPITDDLGLAGVGSWTLGPAAGTQNLVATAAGLPGSPLTFAANATPLTLPQLSIADVTVTEGNTGTANAILTVSLSAPSTKTVSFVTFSANSTATSGTDYTSIVTRIIAMNPGVTSVTIPVTISGDMTYEPTETLTVSVANALNATITDGQAVLTITNDDPLPSLSINDVTVTEGNVGTVNANFVVSLSNPSSQLINVTATTAGGAATSGVDFVPRGPTVLSISPGTTSAAFTVTVNSDTLSEATETFTVGLSAATNSTIADASGTGTILDNDPLPGVSINDVAILEGDAGTSIATFTLTLSAASGQATSVTAATGGGSATAGSDYTAAGPTAVTFAAGVTTQTFQVPVVGDTTSEPDETFHVTLSAPSGLTILDGLGVATITNDDAPPPARVFVSVNGNDGNVCSVQTTPCRTLAAALPQVANDGEVIVLDSGDYATAPISILSGVKISSPSGTVAFIRQPITVNAPGARVALRGLSLKGDGADDCVTLTAAHSLSIEDTSFDSCGVGLKLSNALAAHVSVVSSTFLFNGAGIEGGGGAALNLISVEEVRFLRNSSGIDATAGTFTVRDSAFAGNLLAGLRVASGSVSVQRSEFAFNFQGVEVYGPGTARLARSRVFGNGIGLTLAPGSPGALISFGTNQIRGNTANVSGAVTPVPEQ